MDKRWFEATLRILTDRQRAAEITGDLLEQHPSELRFWWAALRIFAALTWRPAAGILAAFLSLFWSFLPFANSWHQGGSPSPMTRWQMVPMEASYIGMFLWPVACLALAKFGVRSATAAIACNIAALTTLISCSLYAPQLQTAGIGLSATVLLAALLTSANRVRIGALALSCFTIWLVDTATARISFAFLRWSKLSAEHAWRLDTMFTLTGWLFAMVLGWLVLRIPRKRIALVSTEERLADV